LISALFEKHPLFAVERNSVAFAAAAGMHGTHRFARLEAPMQEQCFAHRLAHWNPAIFLQV